MTARSISARLAISNIAWHPDERLGAYRALAEAKFSGLEIAPGLFFNQASDPFKPDSVTAKQALAEIAGHGLRLVSMQSLLFGVQNAALFGTPAEREQFMTAMARAIDLAGRFEIPNLVFGSPGQRRIPEGMSKAAAFEEALAIFTKLGDLAKQAGTVIAIESNPAAYSTNFINTLEQAAEFVRAVSHSSITLILDMGAIHMNGSFERASALATANSNMLSHVHISEPDLAPAPADANALGPVLNALGNTVYDGWHSIEMKRPEAGIDQVSICLKALAKVARDAEEGVF